MGGRTSFAWPGTLSVEALPSSLAILLANPARRRPRVHTPRPDGPRYWLLQPLRSKPQPAISPPLPRQQPAQDVGRAVRTQEATRPGPPGLEARSTSAKGRQPFFPGRTVRRCRFTTLHQRRLLHHEQFVPHAHLHNRTDRDVIAHRAHHTGTADGRFAALLVATAFLQLPASPLATSAVFQLDNIPQPVPAAFLPGLLVPTFNELEHVFALRVRDLHNSQAWEKGES